MSDPLISRSRIVGVFAIVFGLVGTIIPVAALSELNISSGQSAMTFDLSPVVIAVLGHLYLTFCGVTLLRGGKPKPLPYFLAVEAAYGISLMFLLTPLALVGMLSQVQARWSGMVSFGFTLQVISGCPLWGWLLTRKRTQSSP